MRRILLTVATLALTTNAADACGPLRTFAHRVANRVQSRPLVRQVASDVRAVASVPARVVQSRPVATFAADVVKAMGVCRGAGCR